jgi:transposase
MVALVRTGRSVEDLAREFELSAQTIRNWVRVAERRAGTGAPAGTVDALSEAERAEL